MKFPLLTIFSISLLLLSSCKDKIDEVEDTPIPQNEFKITIDKNITYQEMIGFGGGLTWYCDRVTSSPKKDEITDLFFNDLGADIIRLKNWYYPSNYPTNKSPDVMEPNWFGNHFDATNELYDIAKTKNPDIKVLLSSWSPPRALKSNDKLNEGELKKNTDGSFMYEEFGQYWVDILDNIAFTPEYLSIQNEPSYTNSGWETCAWRATEMGNFGGYDQGFNMVYEKIKNRPNVPILIGPESANISTGNNSTTFYEFADAIKDRSYLGAYAYHPYNYGSGTFASSTVSLLTKIGNEYNDRPRIMTEYSDAMDWFTTGRFINYNMIYAGAASYIYWELMWDGSGTPMIAVDAAGNYEVTPFYYLIKHFSKFIDAGYKRVEATSTKSFLETSAYINPAGNKMTVLIINSSTNPTDLDLDFLGINVSNMKTYQSIENDTDLFVERTNLNPLEALNIPSKSITTVVVEF